MKTIKLTEAKTEELKRAICLLDMYRFKASLKSIKISALAGGIELTGRSFKVIYHQLVEVYNHALLAEEAETLTVTF